MNNLNKEIMANEYIYSDTIKEDLEAIKQHERQHQKRIEQFIVDLDNGNKVCRWFAYRNYHELKDFIENNSQYSHLKWALRDEYDSAKESI